MYISADRVSVLVQMRNVGRLAMGLLSDDRSFADDQNARTCALGIVLDGQLAGVVLFVASTASHGVHNDAVRQLHVTEAVRLE